MTTTNGYMLTAQSGNTGGLTWAEAGSGHLTLINTQNLTSGTVNNITVTAFSSTYNTYKILIENLSNTEDTNLLLRFGDGSSFDDGNNYKFGSTGLNGDTESNTGSDSNHRSFIGITGTNVSGNKIDAINGSYAIELNIYNPNQALPTKVTGVTAYVSASNAYGEMRTIGGHNISTTQFTQWKITPSAGSFQNLTRILTYGYNI